MISLVAAIGQVLRATWTAAVQNRHTTTRGLRTAAGRVTVEQRQAEKWLEAMQAGRLHPPDDRRDAQGWDRYWQNHLEVGLMEQGFNDMMSSDPELPALLLRREARRVLCAGNGLSTEATALALLGFEVTALDISSVPASVFAQSLANPGPHLRNAPGCAFDVEHNLVTFSDAFRLDPSGCPPIHRNADLSPRGGGSLAFLTGDLMDAAVCPGPYDVVIERRTVQLFPDDHQPTACERLVGRLAERGLFVSHEHCGHWRPGQPQEHYAERWLRANGVVMWPGPDGERNESAARLALLRFTTG